MSGYDLQRVRISRLRFCVTFCTFGKDVQIVLYSSTISCTGALLLVGESACEGAASSDAKLLYLSFEGEGEGEREGEGEAVLFVCFADILFSSAFFAVSRWSCCLSSSSAILSGVRLGCGIYV